MRKHKRLVECRVNIVDHERCVEQVYGGSRSLGLNANLSLGASLGKWAKGGGGQKKYTCTTGMGGGKMHTGATKVEEVGARGISGADRLNSFELDSDLDSIDFERLVAPDHPTPDHPKPCLFSSVNPKQDHAWPFRNIVNICIYVYVYMCDIDSFVSCIKLAKLE